MKLAISILASALSLYAAGIDGRWSAEATAHNKKAVDRTVAFSLDLKSQGNALTGTVNMAAGKKGRSLAIRDGRIDGNRITFTTKQRGKKANAEFTWTATLDGDRITGTRLRTGARKGQPFTAKRID